MVWSLGGIAGSIAFGSIGDLLRGRLASILDSIGTIAAGLTLYLGPSSFDPHYPVMLPIFGLFAFGIFSGFAIYLPELFPTHIRSAAVGFTPGTARLVTSFGPLVAGLLVGAFGGSFNNVTAFMTSLALLSVVAMCLGPGTRHTGSLR
jgi:MFS family permease